MSTQLPVSAYIDIAPNEYVTKFSFNRNFEKLLSNDVYLYENYCSDTATGSLVENLKNTQTYNKYKTYDANEFVFYKISKSSTRFYVLQSMKGPNVHKPLVSKDPYSGELFVVNSEWWTIVGIDQSEGNTTPKDKADNYVNSMRTLFQTSHQENTSPYAHPTKKLSMKDSSKVFTTMENLDDDRRKLFYPSYLQSLVSDNTILHGYMRKWENGLLEYDLTFRLGYLSSDESGIDILEANNVVAGTTPTNFMYFKENSDYAIFNQKGSFYAVTPTSKQVGLNDKLNAFGGKIIFPESFKDLNYMVFTSNMKNIETEAYNLKIDEISSYDSRLLIDGRTIIGVKDGSSFLAKCEIPDGIVNIKSNALANIEPIDDTPVVFNISPWKSNLVNIDTEAFFGTGITDIAIPQSTRYIGQYAFGNCMDLTCVNFYIDSSKPISSQAKIDANAFTSNVKVVNIYDKPPLLATSKMRLLAAYPHEKAFIEDISLSSRFSDGEFITYIGMNPASVSCYCNGDPIIPTMKYAAAYSQLSSEIATIQLRFSSSTYKKQLMASNKPSIDVDGIFVLDESNAIIGCNVPSISGELSIDLNYMSTKPTAIKDYALSGFSQLTSLTTNYELTSISRYAFNNQMHSIAINMQSGKCYKHCLGTSIANVDMKIDSTPSDMQIQASHMIDTVNVECSICNVVELPENFLQMPSVNQIKIVNAAIVKPNALLCVDFANTLALSASPIGTTLQSYAFNRIKSNKTTLHNGNFEVCKDAFYKSDLTHIDIELSNNTHIDLNAFNNVSTKDITLHVLSQDAFKSLHSMCFNGLSAMSLHLESPSSRAMPTINNILNAMHKLCLMDGTLVYAQKKIMFWGCDSGTWQYFDAYNQYFSYDEDNCISQVNIKKMSSDEVTSIVIPYGCCGICKDAFYEKPRQRSKKISLKDTVKYVSIPSTVKYIGENAFRGLSSIEKIEVQHGTCLQSIGKDAFSQCNSLIGFTFL